MIAGFLPLIVVFLVVLPAIWANRTHNKKLDRLAKLGAFSALPQEERTDQLALSRPVEARFTPAVRGRYAKPATLHLRFALSTGSALFLSQERNGDRILSDLGFSQETQAGDFELDGMFHIVAEDAERAKAFLLGNEARELLLRFGGNNAFEYLKLDGQECALRLSGIFRGSANYEEMIRALGEELLTLAKLAQESLGTAPSPRTASFARRFRLYDSKIPNFSFGAAIFIGVLAFTAISVLAAQPLHPLDAYVFILAALAVIAVAALLVLRPWIRRLQLPSKVFFSFVQGISYLYFVVGTATTLYCNSQLDDEIADEVREPVVSKYISYGKHSARYYHLEVAAPIEPIIPVHRNVNIQTSSSVFTRMHADQSKVALRVHRGFFHIPWYEVDGFEP